MRTSHLRSTPPSAPSAIGVKQAPPLHVHQQVVTKVRSNQSEEHLTGVFSASWRHARANQDAAAAYGDGRRPAAWIARRAHRKRLMVQQTLVTGPALDP
jgi:hypothetical protein